jgi:hypothetical protein
VTDDPTVIPVGEQVQFSDVKSGRAREMESVYKDSSGHYVKLNSAGSTYRVRSDRYKWDSNHSPQSTTLGIHPEAWSACRGKTRLKC